MVSRKQDILKSEKEAFARSSKEAGKAVASILGRADQNSAVASQISLSFKIWFKSCMSVLGEHVHVCAAA